MYKMRLNLKFIYYKMKAVSFLFEVPARKGCRKTTWGPLNGVEKNEQDVVPGWGEWRRSLGSPASPAEPAAVSL